MVLSTSCSLCQINNLYGFYFFILFFYCSLEQVGRRILRGCNWNSCINAGPLSMNTFREKAVKVSTFITGCTPAMQICFFKTYPNLKDHTLRWNIGQTFYSSFMAGYIYNINVFEFEIIYKNNFLRLEI